MRLVVADTSPLRYLVQIDQVDVVPQLFEKIFIPAVVCEELRHPSAPQVVRNWISSVPEWLKISEVRASSDPSLGA
jgi:predicted nucleic acid-binding protein